MKLSSTVRLAMADLRSEAVLTLCLVIAVMAIIAPILILISMKVGFVDRLKNELVNDPSFRELRPADANTKDASFFEALGASDAFEFIAPTVMMVPREVSFIAEANNRVRGEARLLPTAPGDPLLFASQVKELGVHDAVLSSSLAEDHDLAVGDKLTLRATRVLANGRERVETTVTILGFYPAEFTKTPAIIGHPSLDRAIESYRSGVPVPEFGWDGVAKPMGMAFDRVLLSTREPLNAIQEDDLVLRLGASSIEALNWLDVTALWGVHLEKPETVTGAKRSWYVLNRKGGMFTGSDIQAAEQILSSLRVEASGLNSLLPFTDTPLAVVDFRALNFACSPRCLRPSDRPMSFADLPAFGEGVTQANRKIVALGYGEELFPLRLDFEQLRGLRLTNQSLIADWRLGGVLARGNRVPLAYSDEERRLFELQVTHRGFRATASSLHNVIKASNEIERLGYSVSSSVGAVTRLLKLDNALNLLVFVVAGVAFVAGFAVLGINLYANVQRKALSFAIMRLIGIKKREVFLFPIIQALIVVVLGFSCACVVFLLFSWLINTFVVANIGFEGSLSVLRPVHFLAVFSVLIVGSFAACLISALRATQVDPAIALKSGGV